MRRELLLVAVVVVLAIGSAAVFLMRGNSGPLDGSALDSSRADREVSRLKEELARRDETVDRLQSRVRELEGEITAAREELRSAVAGLTTDHSSDAKDARAEANADETVGRAGDGGSSAPVRVRDLESAAMWLRGLDPDQFGSLTLEQAAALQELHLGDVELDDEDLGHLAYFESLVELAISGDGITDDGLAALEGLHDLKRLVMEGTAVTGDGLRHLDGMALEALHLSHSDLAEDGLDYLPSLPDLSQLKLNHVEVTDDVAFALQHLPSLRHVELDGTSLGDDGLDRLLTLIPTLNRIEARGTQVSEDAARALAEQYPGLTIVLRQGSPGISYGR